MQNVTAVVLAGGLGTRIRHLLNDVPKPLALVADKPFLEWQLRYLRGQGITHAIISTGFQADKVDIFASALRLPGMRIGCVKEAAPLGTAGGFLNAVRACFEASRSPLVCNGDSLLLTPLPPLAEALSLPRVDAALFGVNVDDASRFGTLETDPDGNLLRLTEKRPGAGLINAGVYLFRKACVARFPAKRPLSFEYDVFPSLIDCSAGIKVVRCTAPFLDIGTEESFAMADAFIRENTQWFD